MTKIIEEIENTIYERHIIIRNGESIIHNENEDEPSIILTDKNNPLNCEKIWYYNGVKFRRNDPTNPAHVIYKNGKIQQEIFYHKGVVQREDKKYPSKLIYDDNGNLSEEHWCIDGHISREGDLPALIFYENGVIISHQYATYGFTFRSCGPAVISFDENGRVTKESYYQKYGKIHRLDGPAIIFYDENGEFLSTKYYIDGIKLLPEQWLAHPDIVEANSLEVFS